MKSRFLSPLIFLFICNISFVTACQKVSRNSPRVRVSDRPNPSITPSISAPNTNNNPSSTPIVPSPNKTPAPIGVNLGALTYYGTDLPFINVFKNASRWRIICNKTDPNCQQSRSREKDLLEKEDVLDLDRNGWIKSLPSFEGSPTPTKVRSLLFSGAENSAVSGRYIVSYKGEGQISYGGGATVVESRSGEDIINVDLSKRRGIWLEILNTDPQKNGNYIRDIVIVKAENQSKLKTQIFSPEFLEKLQGFEVIRFMDWMDTNKSREKDWDRRTLVQNATYTQTSAPVEVMISLSNKLNVSPWFTMPHMANDEYVTNFAKLVKQDLNPKLKIYVEYSNEIWNQNFPQGKWVQEQAIAEWPASKYPEKDFAKRLNWHGKRTAEVCEIWKKVFANKPKSVVCVMGSQAANPWASAQSLDCPLWAKKPCYKHQIDALAIGAYFGNYIGSINNEQIVTNWSLDRLFEEINSGTGLDPKRTGGALADTRTKMLASFQVAHQRKLNLFAYEGGQHLVGSRRVANNQAITNLFVTANRDPRMGEAYTNLFKSWKDSGGSVFMYFNYVSPSGKWGSWGLLENIGDRTSPKYQSVKNVIQHNK
jgi:hypothetical protein